MSFPNIRAERRTDESFRNQSDPARHKGVSPLERLNIDMIKSFPSSDPLHLFDLGVMKRCMVRWVFGEKGYKRKWNKNKSFLVSRRLENCKQHIPVEIHRAVRNLTSLRKWKGVEFRTMLLYVGMVVFRGILCNEEYEHFLLLCCAVRLCNSKIDSNYHPIVKNMFEKYIKSYAKLYGQHTIGSNIHLLAHVTEDLSDVNNIMQISTYKYENCLRLIGLQYKSGRLPLQQMSRRILENQQLPNNNFKMISKQAWPKLFYSCEDKSEFSKIEIISGVILSSRRSADSWFLTKDNEVVKMCHAKKGDFKDVKVVGKVIKNLSPFFSNPITSSKLQIFISDGDLHDDLRFFNLHSILTKMVCLPYYDEIVLMPLVHTMTA